jgi:protein associated with RNAse G/E
MNTKYIDLKIEAKIISKIANHRLMIRDLFRSRHKVSFPELQINQINHHVSELRTWMRIAERLDKNNVMPYETYYAKQLNK